MRTNTSYPNQMKTRLFSEVEKALKAGVREVVLCLPGVGFRRRKIVAMHVVGEQVLFFDPLYNPDRYVDVANASWTNTIGAPELIAVWKDPEFDAKQSAFYYGRVIEIPTPRWTAYDAKRFGIKAPEGTRMTVTERAYTSPIWYTPGA